MNTAPAKTSVRSLLSRLTQSLENFRAHREDTPLHLLVVFLHVAQRKGIGATELGRLTGLSQSAVSRNIQVLGRGKGDEPGLDLISAMIDPKNPRAHLIRLTAKGVTLARELAGAVRGRGRETIAPSEPAQHLHWQNWID